VIADRASPHEPPALYLFSTTTGKRRRLTTPVRESNGHTAPAFSPDGRKLAFTEMFGPYEHEVFVIDVDGMVQPQGEPRQITSDHRWNRRPAWTESGAELVFARNGLWRVAVGPDSPQPKRLNFASSAAAFPSIHPAGNLLVYSQQGQEVNIWSAQLDAPQEGSPPLHLLAGSSRNDTQPRFSPGGERIAFVSDRSGALEIWICDSNGENAAQLTKLGRLGAPRWSPDGQHIAFDHHPAGHSDIYVIDVSGRGLRRITESDSNDIIPSWSRDGKWIYFGSNRSGRFQVWRIPAAGGEAEAVTRNSGVSGIESSDGTQLFFAAGRGDTQLWMKDLASGQERPLLESVNYHGITVAGEHVYFVEGGGNKTEGGRIRRLRWSQGAVETLFTSAKPLNIGITISPDESRLLYSQVDHAAADLMLVRNFR
jgi:Tol biopolymer transport system component